jgi:rhodanese-related sulfurtransferase
VYLQWYGSRIGAGVLPPREPGYPRAIAETETTPDLDPAAAEEKVGAGAQLIDVRQDYEWEAGRIDGAVHIPLEELPGRANELDRDRPVVFQCRTGSRSAFATQAFREAGFDAYNLEGGLQAWVEAGKPIEPEDGEVAGPLPDGR